MKILLINPRSSNYKARIPNSILQVAASIEGRYEWVFVDGNLEDDSFVWGWPAANEKKALQRF